MSTQTPIMPANSIRVNRGVTRIAPTYATSIPKNTPNVAQDRLTDQRSRRRIAGNHEVGEDERDRSDEQPLERGVREH